MLEVIARCRSCGSPDLAPVLALGEIPLADDLHPPGEQPGRSYPLDVVMCGACGLVQLAQTVSPKALYGERYRYRSSFSDALVAHGERNASRLVAERHLGPDSLVVEIGSNDGALLERFRARGIHVLGIDPAPHPAAAAAAGGVPTRQAFFDGALGDRLRDEGIRPDVVIANNVLAHVPDPNDFLTGIRSLLDANGAASIEVPYVRDLVERCAFDTIYHEHLCYFSVSSLAPLFDRNGLRLDGADRLPIHGGSLRLRVSPGRGVAAPAASLLETEAEAGAGRLGFLDGFADRVREVQRRLVDMLDGIRADGHRIAAYGAAAKGAVLLASCGIGAETIGFVVDRNVDKQGLCMPGSSILIRDPASLMEERPDFVLLLAWNFADEILAQQEAFRRGGGRFVIPIPEPVVV